MLWNMGLLVLFTVTLAAFLVAIEIGFRFGLRNQHQDNHATKAHIGALQAALLGLLALLLGFTFAMAVSRFETRKSVVLDESNAIGTAWLRAQLLPLPQRQDIRKLLKAYLVARIEFHDAGINHAQFSAASATTSRLQNQIWTLAAAAAEQDPRSIPTGLFIQSLNEMIDLSETHRIVLDNHVPDTVVYLLLVVSLGSLGFIAYGSGLSGHRRSCSTAIFALLVALVLVTILDMDRPRRGLIRVNQDSMLRLKEALDAQSATLR